MKKLGNLSLLALLAVGLALVFGGCRRDITAFGSPVTGVTIIDLDPNSDITVGGTKQLVANVLPDNAINKDVTWESDKPWIAEVDENGKVTGVAGGQATITVETDDGGFTASWVVNVKGNQGDSNPPGGGDDTEKPGVITVFDPAKYTGNAGKVVDKDGAKYLEITVDGYNTTIGLDPAVDLKGKTKFKAVMFGEKDNADLQFIVKLADADNGDISSITMASISKSPSEEEAGVAEKQDWNTISETFLCAVIQPMVQDKTAGYGATSGNTVYIGKITAEGNGDITGPGGFGSPVTGVTIDPASAEITVGETKQLFANVLPDNAINKDVTWYSMNPDVATVEQDGKVTGVGEGTAEITVVTDDGGFTASCVVKVEGNQGDSNPPGGGAGTENPGDNDNEFIVFDPATYTGDVGEKVVIDGVTYLEITPDGYGTSFAIPEVDLSGKTTIKCIVFGKEGNANAQAVVQLLDEDWNGITPTLKPISSAPTEVSEDVGEVKKVVRIQPFTQSTADWSVLSDVTIRIGKITAE